MTIEKDVFLSRWVCHALDDYKSSLIAVTGGLGSSKSFGSWQWLYDRLVEFPDCKRAFYTEPAYHLIKSVAITTFEKFAESIGLKEGKHYKINRSAPQVIELFSKGNTQEILLRTCQNPEMIIGFNTGFGVMDEAASCKSDALSRLIARNRMQFNSIPQILCPTTPEGINWFAERFDSDTLADWKSIDDKVDVFLQLIDDQELITKRIKVHTEDNARFLPAGYIANLKQTYGHNQNYLKSYLYGIFAPFSEGLAVENYNPRIHDLVEEKLPNPNETIFLTWDWNAKPLSWIAVDAEYNEYKEMEYTCLAESELNYSQIEDCCIEFSVKFNPIRFQDTEIQIDGDPSGFNDSHKSRFNDFERVKDQLIKLGFKNVRIQATNRKMREIDTLDALNKVFFENRLFLNKLKELKRSLMMTQLKKNERKIDKPASEDWTHKVDALKYLICRLELEGIKRGKDQLQGFRM